MKNDRLKEIIHKRDCINKQQKQTQYLLNEVEQQIKNCYHLYKKEQNLNDQLLNHFQGLSEHFLVDNMTDDMRDERRQLFDCLDEVHDILKKEQWNLTIVSDYLRDEEFNILREKEETNGKDKYRRNTKSD